MLPDTLSTPGIPMNVPTTRQPLAPGLIRDLESIVGKGFVLTDPARLVVYESDGLTSYRSPPQAVVLPGDRDEVVEVVRRLARAGVPLVPRGAGTGLSGGALASEGGVIVGTARLDRILEIDPENRRARLEPGVVNAHLSEAARPFGLHYAPDPSSQTACTIGGNVAENSGGPHCLKYGVTSRYVTGLTVVLPEGETLSVGGLGRPRSAPDLVGLFVGSEGCFGVTVEVEVALVPIPEAVRTLLAIFPDLETAGAAVSKIIAAGLLPAALEIIDQETIRAVEASVFAAGYPVDAGAALVVEFDGFEAGLEADVNEAVSCCRDSGATEIRRASSEEERLNLWKGRKKAFGAMGRIAPDLMVQDATVPRTKLPQVLREIDEIGREFDLTLANVFHAGDGNLHPNILFDRRDEQERARVEEASKRIMEVCVRAGGTITGEHGVGLDKRRYMGLVYRPEELDAMRRVRSVLDPRGRCNPGKVLPEDVLPATDGPATSP